MGTGRPAVVAIADHVGLTWDSPLHGPNDERIGPRFPRTDGVYAPEAVRERLGSDLGVTISVATVAGVRDDRALTTWEREMVGVLRVGVVSAELVPVAVIAAHLGLRLAAAVILQS
jgi:purine-nucleoside phosphorylase